MLDKTTKTAIASQPAAPAARNKQASANDARRDAPSLDKAVAGLTLADDHRAPVARAPSLVGVQAPQGPRKTKSETLRSDQRALLQREFSTMSSAPHAARSREVASVPPGERARFKEPSMLEFVGAQGDKQRWFISHTQRTGSYGKFRIAVKDVSAQQPQVIRAIKEYRLEDRRETEQVRPSATQRKSALAALVKIEGKYRMLGLLVRSLMADLRDASKPLSTKYDKMVDYIENGAQGAGLPIDDDTLAALRLTPKTRHIDAEAIARENGLYPLAQSPLQVSESVVRNGRVYNFSELMRGELFDVVTHPTLDASQRKSVSRAAARQATAALQALHEVNIIHRDIKPENLFLDHAGDAQLGDWGFATLLKSGKATEQLGTMDYIAPEIIANKPYGKPVDIYSLGLTLAVASSGRFLIDIDQTMFFEAGGKMRSSQHEALSLVIEALRLEGRNTFGAKDLQRVKDQFRSKSPACPTLEATTELHRAIGKIIGRIEAWHAQDGAFCATVLGHMLRRDPAARSDAKTLNGLFAQIQPAQSTHAAKAQQVGRDILTESTDVEAEVAVLQAYAKAYTLAAPAEASQPQSVA